jgi:hypothetical protein
MCFTLGGTKKKKKKMVPGPDAAEEGISHQTLKQRAHKTCGMKKK